MYAEAQRSLWARIVAIAEGMVLPLASPRPAALTSPARTVRARVLAVQAEAVGIRTLTLRPGRTFRPHRSGEFVALTAQVEGRVITAAFSITSAPERSQRAFTVTASADGGELARHLVRSAKVGDGLVVAEPEGQFVLPTPAVGPFLFITGGIGVTAVMAALRSFEARGTMPNIVHVHYARTVEDALFRTELLRLAAEFPSYRLQVVTTREGATEGARISQQALDDVAPDWKGRDAWVSGPPALAKGAERCFRETGHASQLHVERFVRGVRPPPSEAR